MQVRIASTEIEMLQDGLFNSGIQEPDPDLRLLGQLAPVDDDALDARIVVLVPD